MLKRLVASAMLIAALCATGRARRDLAPARQSHRISAPADGEAYFAESDAREAYFPLA